METVLTILSYIAAFVLLSLLVTVHELGHFGVGKMLGFRIDEFAVGMGPKVFSRKKGDTLFALRALPIGGMCRFYGEDEEADSAQSFSAQRPWKRLLVVLAGPVTNILATFLIAAVFLMAYGDYVYKPTVESLSDEIPIAQEAGMQPGDILYAVDGVVIDDYSETVDMIRNAGDDMVVTVQRGEALIDIPLHGAYNEEAGYNLIGINMVVGIHRQKYPVFQAMGQAFPFVFDLIRQTISAIIGMFQNGVQQGDVMGVVGTVTVISYAVRTNFDIVMYIAILLSISLAIMNLLPLPALDGGRAVFIVVEMIRGKPIPPEKEGMVHFVGFVLLIGLVILVTFSDIRMLIANGS